jgi:hypothetical protein
MIMEVLSTYQAWIWMRVVMSKFLNYLGVRNILYTNCIVWEHAYVWLAVFFVALLLWIGCCNGVKSAHRETGTE